MFGCNGYVHYFHCGDGFMGFICKSTNQIQHFKYKQLIVFQFYLNKAVQKTKKKNLTHIQNKLVERKKAYHW